MKKRILALFLVIVLAVSLVGCVGIPEASVTDSSVTEGGKVDNALPESSGNSAVGKGEASSQPESNKSDESDISSEIVSSLPVNSEVSSENSSSVEAQNLISKDKAKKIALEYAGVKESEIYDYDFEFDTEKGDKVYEISFETDKYEFDIKVGAKDGTIIKAEKEERDDKRGQNSSVTSSASSDSISKDKAKKIALEYAGVKESEIYDYDIELDIEKAEKVYEISFETDKYEFDIKVGVKDGKIIKAEKENQDDKHGQNSSVTSSASSELISKARAKEIALSKADGVKENEIRDYEIELDTEKGEKVYEISFETGRYDYEFVINAKTGEVIRAERDD